MAVGLGDGGVRLKPILIISCETFNLRSYYGVAHQSRKVIDEHIASGREGWD